jgi:phage gpG-like protein
MAIAGQFFIVEMDSPEIDELLDDLGAKGANLAPVMAIIAEDLVAAVSDMYETQGHGTWPPLAPSTIAKRRGSGSGQSTFNPMQDSGRLAGSTEPNHGPDFAEATTNVDYVRFHLDGGPIIPKRNPFEIPESHYDEAVETILDYVIGS